MMKMGILVGEREKTSIDDGTYLETKCPSPAEIVVHDTSNRSSETCSETECNVPKTLEDTSEMTAN
jgi:hypothetical protein